MGLSDRFVEDQMCVSDVAECPFLATFFHFMAFSDSPIGETCERRFTTQSGYKPEAKTTDTSYCFEGKADGHY